MFDVPQRSWLRNKEAREAVFAFVLAWCAVCMGLTCWAAHNFPTYM